MSLIYVLPRYSAGIKNPFYKYAIILIHYKQSVNQKHFNSEVFHYNLPKH